MLTAFAETAVKGSQAELTHTRDALEAAMGKAAVVDAAAVVANFERMVRIADGTGIPLDKPMALLTVDMRSELGIDRYGSASETPEIRGVSKIMGRLAQPLMHYFMSRYTTKRG